MPMKTCKILLVLVSLFLLFPYIISSQNIKERVRKVVNERFDKLKLREQNDFVVDTSFDFLKKPQEEQNGEYGIAQAPPTVHMKILPDMEPEYLTDVSEDEVYLLGWANWARMARSDDNRFYCAVSDHRGTGSHINLYEYCPARNVIHKVLDVKELLGWSDGSLTDGKLHGHMGIMPDGTLWGATHYGVYPDSTWWANGYRGSWLFSYNIYTHEAKNWGVPMVGEMLPSVNVDTRHGRLVGSGPNNMVLAWDCFNKKVTYAGYPPDGWVWWRRGLLCDLATGNFWTTDNSDDRCRFLSFDPEFNRFERYEVSPPPNPYNDVVNNLRGYTDSPAMDGWFYCCSKSEEGPQGRAFFKFKPNGVNGPEVEPLGVNWGNGEDVLQMVLSPKGRYVYYYPRSYPAPLVQYDVVNGTKKAICWLHDYYYEKYGYWIGGSYGMEISTDGSFIVVCMNGSFQGKNENYGHPSLFVIHIPESERPE